jgi:sigma-E factor negative regulatory protein RseC
MSSASEVISHPGIVQSLDNGIARVKIQSVAACGSCTVKGACSMAEMEEKIIDIPITDTDTYTIGEMVTVSMNPSLGNLAVVLGYLVPFILVLATLIVSIASGLNEGLAGLLSLAVLVPYYLIIHKNKKRLSKTFTFHIHSSPNF